MDFHKNIPSKIIKKIYKWSRERFRELDVSVFEKWLGKIEKVGFLAKVWLVHLECSYKSTFLNDRFWLYKSVLNFEHIKSVLNFLSIQNQPACVCL